jgi:hypothetical protein
MTLYEMYCEASDLYQTIWEAWLEEPGQTPRDQRLYRLMKRAEARRIRRAVALDRARDAERRVA